MSYYPGTPTQRLSVELLPEDKKWTRYIPSLLTFIIQILGFITMYQVTMTLTDKMALAIPTALVLQPMFSGIAGLLFLRRAMDAYSVKIMISTPGGVAALAFLAVILAVIYLVQPILIVNGYSQAQSMMLTIIAPLIYSLTSSVVSSQLTARVLSNVWQKIVCDAVLRQNALHRRVEHMIMLQDTLLDTQEMLRDVPADEEGHVSEIFSETDTQAANMTRLIMDISQRSPRYLPAVYRSFLQDVRQDVSTVPYAQQLEAPTTPVLDQVDPTLAWNIAVASEQEQAINRRHADAERAMREALGGR